MTTNNKTLIMNPAVKLEDAEQAILTLDFNAPFTEQVKNFVINHIAALAVMQRIILVGQAVGATLLLPAIEMISGLPEVGLYQPGQEGPLGWLKTGDYRHQEVRGRRTDIPEGEAFGGITVLDGGGRGLTPTQHQQIAAKFGVVENQVRVLNLGMGQVDMANPTAGMIEKVLNSGLTTGDAKHPERLLYVPAGAGLIGALMALTIYGLTETWPQTVRLNKVGDEFVVAEIVSPQDMRQFGAQALAAHRSGSAPVVVPRELFEAVLAALEGTDLATQLSELV